MRIADLAEVVNNSEVSSVLADIPVGDVSLATLVTLFVVLVLTGRLVPKSTVDQMRAEHREQITAERAATESAGNAVTKLLEVNMNQATAIRDLTPAARVGVRIGEEVHNLAAGQTDAGADGGG